MPQSSLSRVGQKYQSALHVGRVDESIAYDIDPAALGSSPLISHNGNMQVENNKKGGLFLPGF